MKKLKCFFQERVYVATNLKKSGVKSNAEKTNNHLDKISLNR